MTDDVTEEVLDLGVAVPRQDLVFLGWVRHEDLDTDGLECWEDPTGEYWSYPIGNIMYVPAELAVYPEDGPFGDE